MPVAFVVIMYALAKNKDGIGKVLCASILGTLFWPLIVWLIVLDEIDE